MAGETRTPLAAARRIAAGAAFGVLLLAVILYLARTIVFSWLAELYLLSYGVPSSVSISRLDWDGLDARVRLGARRTPDLGIENVHAVFDGGWIPQLRSLALSHSVLRVAFDGEKLSFGTLQRLVDSFTAPAPSGPVRSASPPHAPLRIVLRDAKVLGFTPAGVVSLAGNGVVAGGKVERFLGNIGRANLRAPGFALMLSGGSFTARSDASGLNIHAAVGGHGVMFERVRASEGQLALDLFGLRWGDGQFSFAAANANLRAVSINGRGLSVGQADARLKFGAWKMGDAQATGSADGVIDLTKVRTASANADKISLHLASQGLVFDQRDWHVSGPVAGGAVIADGRYRAGSVPLVIASASATAKGEARVTSDGVTGSWTASLAGDLAMARGDARKFAKDIPFLGSDARNVRAVASALQGVTLEAPNIYIGKSSAPLVVTLPEPITLASRSGARAKLAQSGDIFLSLGADGRMAGGFAASLFGGGLPSVNLSVSQFAAREKADGLVLDATLVLSGRASTRALRDFTLVTNGHLKAERGGYAFVPEGCARVGLGAYLSEDKPTFSKLRTEICASPHQPFLSSTVKGWRLGAVWRNLSATLDAADALAASKSGRLEIAGDSNGLSSGFVESSRARLTDAKPTQRFSPLLASGRLSLQGAQWRGGIGVVIAQSGRKLASVALHHDTQTQTGEALIVSDMAFVPDGFQPGELSPLLASLTQTTGAAKFRGRIAWTAQGQTSGGKLIVQDADFSGPLGAVKQANSEIIFTSLSPLATAPAQTLTAQRIDWLVPFSGLVLKFQLAQEALRIESFEAAAANGHVALAPMTVALDPKATLAGTLKLDRVNLSALIAASNLSDKVSLDAPVTGEIPFRYGPQGLRVANGYFAAIGPARLSIRRSVWTGGEAQGSTDAIRDFAYQALENLAIDALDAKLNSLPAGRLGVVFHIKGRNDPAVAQETRIGIIDLIQGHAFDKPLPLPKGTPVDLTLDTSLNFDELLDAYRHAFSADLAQAAATSEQNEGKKP